MQSETFFKIGAWLGGIAVIAGAFGAHSLENFVTAERLDTFKTGVTYHMYHALALLVVGWIGRENFAATLRWAGYCFCLGILLFSGSLYLLVITDTGWLGAVTPFGGLAFIAGWIMLAMTLPLRT